MNGLPKLRGTSIDILDRRYETSEREMERHWASRKKLAEILFVAAIGVLALYLIWRGFPLSGTS